MRYVILKTAVGSRVELQKSLPDHRKYLEALKLKGILLAAGNFEDRSGSMTIVEANGLEEAIQIARTDPLVQSGVERYLVRGWSPLLEARYGHIDQMDLPLEPVTRGPIPSPDQSSFQVVEAREHPRHQELLQRCFAPKQIRRDDPSRLDYLRRNGAQLGKLLLVHRATTQVAGQLEYAPPGAAGLPIEGSDLAVINCLWVTDAFTGSNGARALLASCARRSGASSLATIGFNSTLPYMGRGFFERQGFTVVDQLETGRFFGDTPIVSYLLWRPLSGDATAPHWDRDEVKSGVSFCPCYPWLFGRRLYWGRDFAFHGTVVKEGLRRLESLTCFPMLAQKRVGNWTLIKIGVSAADLNNAIALLQEALVEEPTYFANLYGGHDDRLIVVFPRRVFKICRDRATWKDAIRYGLEQGIPQQELIFGPGNFDDQPRAG